MNGRFVNLYLKESAGRFKKCSLVCEIRGMVTLDHGRQDVMTVETGPSLTTFHLKSELLVNHSEGYGKETRNERKILETEGLFKPYI